MHATTVTITPEMAEEFLGSNPRNRPMKRQHLAFLCEEMRSGRWKTNGDTIRIGVDGTLIDGQHRLEAVRQTGTPITTLLVTGLELDAFDTIDSGAKRSAGDTLAVAGEKNGRNLAAALVVADDLLAGRTDFVRSMKTSNAEVLNMLDRHPEIRDSLSWGKALVRLAPASISVAMHYIFRRRNKEKADAFFNAVATGVGLEFDSPAYLLRQRLIDNATAKGKLTRRYTAALFIKAWNSFNTGQRLKYLRFREVGDAAEPFPTVR